jgi:cell volume regulation protein A
MSLCYGSTMEQIGLINLGLLFLAVLILVGIASSLIATRFGAPLLLVFLIIGMLAGEDGPGGIVFNDYRLTYLVGTVALAIILFDGGLRTRLAVFRGSLLPASLLATVGVVITAGLTGALACLVLGLSWLEGLLLGAVVSSTDAAAVFFLMRAGGLQLRRRVAAALEIESGTNDPFAVFLTIVLVELILLGPHGSSLDVVVLLLRQVVIGTVAGIAGGHLLVQGLNRMALPSGLHPLFAITAALAIYGAAASVEGSGFLAVYLAGLVLGNRPTRAFPSILSFHDAATWLSQILMFLVLGLLVTPSKLLGYLLPAILIAIFIIVIARPVAVWLCLWPFKFTAREKAFVSWVGLRGAVSIFLAAIPTLSGVPNAELYFNVAFVAVFISLLVQGWTLTAVARGLGVALTETAAETQRVEIDLPGQINLEMVGFPIIADSPILTRPDLPTWIQPVMVARQEKVQTWAEAKALMPGDYAYFLVPTERAQRLDRLFAASEAIHTHHPVAAFNFTGDISLDELETAYGLTVPDDIKGLTVTQAFRLRCEDRIGMGDRIQLGPASLTVAELDGEDVKQAALEIDEVELPPQVAGADFAAFNVFARLQALVARLAERFNLSAKDS